MELWGPFKWPYKWVIGVITLINGVIFLLINGRGPPCSFLYLFWWTLCCFSRKWNWNISEVVVVNNYHDSRWFYSWRILSNCRTWCVLCNISSKEPPLFEQKAFQFFWLSPWTTLIFCLWIIQIFSRENSEQKIVTTKKPIPRFSKGCVSWMTRGAKKHHPLGFKQQPQTGRCW